MVPVKRKKGVAAAGGHRTRLTTSNIQDGNTILSHPRTNGVHCTRRYYHFPGTPLWRRAHPRPRPKAHPPKCYVCALFTKLYFPPFQCTSPLPAIVLHLAPRFPPPKCLRLFSLPFHSLPPATPFCPSVVG